MSVSDYITARGRVLAYYAAHPKATMRQAADALGLTERTVGKQLVAMAGEGVLSRTKKGRNLVTKVHNPGDAAAIAYVIERLTAR